MSGYTYSVVPERNDYLVVREADGVFSVLCRYPMQHQAQSVVGTLTQWSGVECDPDADAYATSE